MKKLPSGQTPLKDSACASVRTPLQDENEGREAEPCHAHSILERTTLSI